MQKTILEKIAVFCFFHLHAYANHAIKYLSTKRKAKQMTKITLTTYVKEQVNAKSWATRNLIARAKIERDKALKMWLARDWLTYHRTYFMKGYLSLDHQKHGANRTQKLFSKK